MITEKLAVLFDDYDMIVAEIAQFERIAATDRFLYPSQIMNALSELHLEKWATRRRINSTFAEMEQQKPLWKRILKK